MRTTVTNEYIESRIRDVNYHRIPDTTITICIIRMVNGYSVTGESACVSAANFDSALGKKYAYDNAMEKLWPLEGYLLAEQLRTTQSSKRDRIARVCHEVNRAYCEALGDTSQVAWENAPEWQCSSARLGVDMHLSGNFGPEASHASWMDQKLADGWKYGPEKDVNKKEHPCLVPFSQLPREQQAKDYIFRAVVHALQD